MRYVYDPTGERKAVLPEPGERLEFGKHRLAAEERECPMWPDTKVNPFAKPLTKAWMKAGLKDNPHAVMLLARVKAGEVENSTAATIVVRNTRTVTWVTQAEAEARRAAIQEDWLAGRISLDEAQARARDIAA